jgi:hypothetical protein
MTGFEACALTVAGQWRNFTAFPSILTILVVNSAAISQSSVKPRNQISLTRTFISGARWEVKNELAK